MFTCFVLRLFPAFILSQCLKTGFGLVIGFIGHLQVITTITYNTVTSRKVAGSNSDEVDFFNLPYLSSRTMALGSTQPLTDMSTRNIPGGKGWPARKADILTAICEPIV
jgi:hypothetical protein